MLLLFALGEHQMKKLTLMFWLIAFFTFAGQAAYACSCGKIMGPFVFNDDTPKPDSEEVRKWRLEQTDSALFIGSIIKIEKVKVKWSEGSDERFPMKKVTVRVEKYWLGVKTPEMIIYTGVGGGDCGVPYVKGKQYFFWASRARVSGLSETDICSPTKIDTKLVAAFNAVFGEAKVFL
jgi:hypothetical protein